MTTLDDIRQAGFTVNLAWEGWEDVPDVYAVSRELPFDPETGIGGTELSYLPDDPDALAMFLEREPRESETPE